MELIKAKPLTIITPEQTTTPLSHSSVLLKKAFKKQGALLLRGFNFNSVKFKKLSEIFCDTFHISAVKFNNQLKEDSDSFLVSDKNYTLLGHTEGAYKPANAHPKFCFFWCLIPPSEAGGETVLVDGVKFFEELSSKTQEKLITNKIIYEMIWDKERWQNEFSITDVSQLQGFLANIAGVTYTIKGSTLHMRYKTSALRTIKTNGVCKQAFSNGLLAHLPKIFHPKYEKLNVYCKSTNQLFFENGEKISDEIINELIDTYDKLSYLHNWQKNDVLIIDNVRYLHGRLETEKNCIRNLVSKFGF